MNVKYLAMISSGLVLSIGLSFYLLRSQHRDRLNESHILDNIKGEGSSQKSNENFKKNIDEAANANSITKNLKDMTPHEYVAWLKDPRDRVLLEVNREGASLYRKGNVTITVMPDGKELYLPDEF